MALPRGEGSFTAVGLAFASNALVWGSVVPRIPDLTDRLDASPGEIALPLFAYMFGGLVTSWGSASVLRRHTPARGQLVGVLAGATAVALGVMSSTLWVVAVLLWIGGLGDGLQDVAMNAAGVDLEDAQRRPRLSRLHAVWSVAFLGASGLGAGAAALEVSVAVHVPAMCVVAGLVGVAAAGGFPEAPRLVRGSRRHARLPALLVMVGVATAFGALMELVANDWSALYLRDHLGASAGVAALGPVVFMAGMVLGRLLGDGVVRRVGPARTLAASAATVAVALGSGLTPDVAWAALAGLGVAGIGSAFTFPGLFSLAARVPGVGREQGLAVVSTTGRVGFVVGPLLAGGVAEATSLRMTMYLPVVAASALVVSGLVLARAHPWPPRGGT